MRPLRLLSAALVAIGLAVPVHADQLLGQGRIDSSNRVLLPGGPTLGRYQGGKYIATPDALQLQGSGSTGDASGLSAGPSGGVLRQQGDRLLDGINIKDFGAKGDGTANDTAAWQAAHNRAIALGRPVLFPQGVYLIDFMDMRDRARIVPLVGQGDVVIRKRVDDGRPLFQINDDGIANNGLVFPRIVENIRFDADKKAAYALLAYNLARWHFPTCKFINAKTDGALFLGGIQITLDGIDAYNNGRAGVAFDRYAYGYPNLSTVSNSGLFDNGKAGVYFDGGRVLQLLNNDYEGNGKADDPTSGAVVTGAQIGVEEASGVRAGITLIGGWIEANKSAGGAIVLGSGYNRIIATYTIANATPFDVLVSGGTYSITDSVFDGVRSHVKDGSGAGFGNTLANNRFGGTNEIDPARTAFYGAGSAWTPFSPTVSSDTGVVGSVSYADGAYQRIGNTMHVRVSLGIETAGTAGGDLYIRGMPAAASADVSISGLGGAGSAVGVMPARQIFARVRKYDGTTLFANGASFIATFSYEVAN